MPSKTPDLAASTARRCDVVFDGGSLGNPGRGYGSYRLRFGNEDWGPVVRLEHGSRITNNEAEYRTLIGALEALLALVPEPGGAALEVFGDSQLVLRQLEGKWKVRAGNLVADHARARALLAPFGQVRLIWQPRARSVALLGH
jgi:ribonuclease HI